MLGRPLRANFRAVSLLGRRRGVVTTAPPPAPPPPPPSGDFPTVPSTGFVTFGLLPSATVTDAPWTVGHTFVQGDLPSGSGLDGVQCTVKSTWPDGSAKIAVLAGGCDVTNGVTRTVGLAIGTAPSGTALSTTDLQGALTDAVTIDCGVFGSASWSGSDLASPFSTWVSGPLMSSWIYRKAVGADAHLTAWLEVRLWIDGSVEVLPWIENGYIMVAAPTNKSATYSFTLGGTSRFSAAIDLKHHQRTPLVSGSLLSHWLGTDPGLAVRHDVAYMQSTELVPTYRASVSSGNSLVTALPATFTPLQQGSFTYTSDDMSSSGYQKSIGLLPQHDVLYLVSTAPAIYSSVIRNGFSAGRYGIHYRDEATNRPLLFSSYSSANIANGQGFKDNGSGTPQTPTATGGGPPGWDVAHSPSVGYMAYLLTGRHYFMEEVQFAATCNFLGHSSASWGRNGTQGLVQTATDAWQTRSMAWQWRTLAQALCVTPDADTAIRTQFINSVQNSINALHATYVAQANNTFGWVKPGETYSGGKTGTGAAWQQDFVTAAFGYSKCLGLPISGPVATKLDAFFEWKAKSIVGRLGTDSDFPFEDANRYNVKISATDVPDYTGGTGPWYADTAAVYAATAPLANTPDNPLHSTPNVLATEYDATSAAKGQWGELQMAIAYAVRWAVPGALAGYNRMIGASNWASMLTTTWDSNYPVMAVKPASGESVAMPAYMTGRAVGEWFAISGTTANGRVNDFSGIALREETGMAELCPLLAGGHAGNLTNNSVLTIDLFDDAPAWVERKAAASPGAWATTGLDGPRFPTGEPAPRHTYCDVGWSPELGAYFAGGRYWGSSAADWTASDSWNPTTNAWVNLTNRGSAGTWRACRDPSTGLWYSTSNHKTWDPATDTWATWTITGGTPNRQGCAFDTTRDFIYHLSSGDNFSAGSSVIKSMRINKTTGVATAITFNSSAAWTTFQAEAPSFLGSVIEYDPTRDRYYFYNGTSGATARIYEIIPNGTDVWDMIIVSVTGATPPVATSGSYRKGIYIDSLKLFVTIDGGDNIYAVRMS